MNMYPTNPVFLKLSLGSRIFVFPNPPATLSNKIIIQKKKKKPNQSITGMEEEGSCINTELFHKFQEDYFNFCFDAGSGWRKTLSAEIETLRDKEPSRMLRQK